VRSIILKPLYGIALDGLPFLGTPAATAARFVGRPGSLHLRAEEMAQTHLALCTSTGFVCGLGGFLTLPITLPANVAGVALIQLHLCASTAFLGSHDPHAAQVRELAVQCLTGAIAPGPERDETQEVVDRSAVKIAERGLRLLAETALAATQAASKFTAGRLMARRIPRRSLPLVGGFIGGASDLYATQKVAAAAREAFLPAKGEAVAPSLHLVGENGSTE